MVRLSVVLLLFAYTAAETLAEKAVEAGMKWAATVDVLRAPLTESRC